MIIEINDKNIKRIKNVKLASYAARYLDIYNDYLKQITRTGLNMAAPYDAQFIKNKKKALVSKGAISRNNGYSLYVNRISEACEACQKGIGGITFFIDLNCIRKCFFCFNPNQENYSYFLKNKRDCISELKRIHHQGMLIKHLALTGGEPLLHPDETIDFFKTAKALYPKVFTRLYTCGDLINRDILKRLKNTKLDEIRFSLRVEDSPEETSNVLQKIQSAKEYIPKVMVEMPVIPGNYSLMENFLRELDNIGVFGINLLEFCFPFNNAEEFCKRKLKIKNPPHHILYNYWYGGGLPVAESEKGCLELLEFALEEKLKVGVHYCSLENKHTAQIFQQNKRAKLPPHIYMSNKDYFLKSAKVFGDDRQKVLEIFNKIGYQDYLINEGHENIEFHVGKIKYLKGLDIEIGIVTGIMEEREDGLYFRELKIDLAYPQNFEKTRNGDTTVEL